MGSKVKSKKPAAVAAPAPPAPPGPVAIVIPSYKREATVLTTQIVNGAILCVPVSQAAGYRKANPGVEIVDHPDTVLGLSLKRQWIYETFGDVFMLDDDLTSARTTQLTPNRNLSRDEFTQVIQVTARTCRQLGAFLFGFGNMTRPAFYKPQKPFKLTGYVNGCSLGLLKGSKLRFSSDCVAVEDYYISCMNALHHRMAFIDNRYVVNQKNTFSGKGGLSLYRTMDTEKKDTEILMRLFGNVIMPKATDSDGRRPNGSRTSHPHERSLHLPF